MTDGAMPRHLTGMDAILARYEGRQRDALLPLLHEAQALNGWLPREVQEAVGKTLRVPLADIHGVIEFYTMFYNEPTFRHVIRVCEDPACFLAGSEAVAASLEDQVARRNKAAPDGEGVTLERVPCLGMCELGPSALNGVHPAGDLKPTDAASIVTGDHPEPPTKVYGEPRIILRRVGERNPTSLQAYLNRGGFEALGKAIALDPEDLISIVERTGILGRGGAMFPLGRKWRFTHDAPGGPSEKHIVVNADESEPGTFKDRGLVEEDPFAIIEAATIAAFAVGAQNGWIFVRGEYPRGYERLHRAVERAREEGYLGKSIMGRPGFDFDIELRLGAGAYICGEETALFEAIEGRRGFPRIKPPFPVTHGLFGQPTVVNNVETLAAVRAAIEMGVSEWRQYGTEQSPGTKLFCLSGHVSRPGVYEVPFGIRVRELIDLAGGVESGKAIQAVLLGGAAGVFVGPDQLDMRLTYEDSRAQGVPIGSGVIMVFDETADLRKTLYQLARFFAHESCGKCFPCQLGTQRQAEILARAADSGASTGDVDLLQDLGFAMTETSLCGLGQTASTAVLSAIELWPDLLE